MSIIMLSNKQHSITYIAIHSSTSAHIAATDISILLCIGFAILIKQKRKMCYKTSACTVNTFLIRPLFVDFMFSSENFQDRVQASRSLSLSIMHISTKNFGQTALFLELLRVKLKCWWIHSTNPPVKKTLLCIVLQYTRYYNRAAILNVTAHVQKLIK